MFSALSKALDRRSLPSSLEISALHSAAITNDKGQEDDEVLAMMKEYMELQKQQLALEKLKFEQQLALERQKLEQTLAFEKEKFREELEFRKAEFEWRKHVDQSLLDMRLMPRGSGVVGGDEIGVLEMASPPSQAPRPVSRQITNTPHEESHENEAVKEVSRNIVTSAPTAVKPKKVFISYCWRNSRTQKELDLQAGKATKLDVEKAGAWDPRIHTYDIIKQLGLDPWLDVEQLKVGNGLLTSLAEVLSEEVSLVIVHASEEYAASANCKKEFEFAASLDLKILPLVVGESPQMIAQRKAKEKEAGPGSKDGASAKAQAKPWTKGWLGFNINSLLYVDTTNPSELKSNIQRVSEVLAKSARELVVSTVQKSTEGYKTVQEATRAKDDTAVINMLKSMSQEALKDFVETSDDLLDLAVQNLGPDAIKSLLSHGVKIAGTPVISAIRRDSKEILEALLQHGVDVNAVDSNQSTGLHIAASLGSVGMLEVLLHHDAKIEEVNIFGYTPLLSAVSATKLEAVKLLLKHGANQFAIDDHTEGNAMNLIMACTENHADEFEIFKVLLEAKTPIDCVDENGHTVLESAVFGGKIEVVKVLASLENSSEVFGEKNLATVAAVNGHLDMLKFLTSEACPVKYDLFERDSDGENSISGAIGQSHLEMIKYLVGLDKRLLGCMKYQLSMLSTATGKPEILRYLIMESGHPFDLNEIDSVGNTCLSYLMQHDDLDLCKYIINREPALLHTLSIWGDSLLNMAASAGKLEMVEYLLAQDKEFFLKSFEKCGGSNPLLSAISSGSMDVVRLLVNLDASLLQAVDSDGKNVLHAAASSNQFDCLKYLLGRPDCVKDLHLKTNTDDNVLSYAIYYDNVDMIAFLLYKDETLVNSTKGGKNVLIQAAYSGSWSSAKYLLSRQSTFNFMLDEKSVEGDTLAITAAATGQLEILEALIAIDPALLDATNLIGDNLLICACRGGQTEIVKYLVNHPKLSYDLEYCSCEGVTAMLAAASSGVLDIVKFLHEKNPNLMSAVSYSGTTFLRFLLEDGDPSELLSYVVGATKLELGKRDSGGEIPLSFAVNAGKSACVPILIAADDSQLSFKISGENILHLAATNDNVGMMKAIVQTNKIDLHELNNAGRTPFAIAVSNGNWACTKYLFEVDATQVYVGPDYSGNTLLHLACTSGSLDVCKLVLNACKADLDAENDSGQTPLAAAIRANHVRIANYLIEADASQLVLKANSNLIFDFFEAGGDVQLLKTLLENHNFDLNAKDYGGTPFFQAIQDGHFGCAQYLLSKDASLGGFINSEGMNVAHAAATTLDNVKCLRLVVERCNIDLNQKDFGGRTPLSAAINYGNEACIDYLIGLDKKQFEFRNEDDGTLLHELMRLDWDPIDPLKALLAAHQFDLGHLDADGNSILSLAVKNDHIKCVRLLISLDVSLLEFKSPEQSSLIALIPGGSSPRMLNTLLSAGCKFDAKKDGCELLASAVEEKNINVVRRLIELGVEVSPLLNSKGCNLLHLAVEAGDSVALLELLTSAAKFDVRTTDGEGYTPFAKAILYGRTGSMRYLLSLDPTQINDVFVPENKTMVQLAMNITWDKVSTLRFLLSCGKFDLNSKDSAGQTPLSYELTNGYFDQWSVVQELLTHDLTQLDYVSEDTNSNILQLSVGTELRITQAIWLASQNTDLLHHIDSDGYTALAKAVGRGHISTAHYLARLDSKQLSHKMESTGQNLLHLAVSTADVQLLKLLLSLGQFDLTERDNEGNTVLSLSVAGEYTNCVKHLLSLDSSLLDWKSSENDSLVHLAAKNYTDNIEILQSLLEAGTFDLTEVDSEGYTPFGRVVSRGNLDCAKFLYAKNPSVISISNGTEKMSLMRLAVEYADNARLLKFIHGLEKTDLKQVAEDGHTVLSKAVQSGFLQAVKFLVQLDPTLVEFIYEPEHETLLQLDSTCNSDIIKVLLAAGTIDLHNVAKDKSTVLTKAIDNAATDVIEYLVKRDPSLLGFIDSKDNKTLIQKAAAPGTIDVLQALLSTGYAFDFKNIDSEGHTAVSAGLQRGASDWVRRLVAHDKSLLIHTVKKTNQSTLHYATISYLNGEFVKAILQTGNSDVHQVNVWGRTPLAEAIYQGNEESVQLLLNHDPSLINFKQGDDNLLHIASEQTGSVKIYKLLIERGNFDLHECGGSTRVPVVANCIRNGYVEAVQYLVSLDPSLLTSYKDQVGGGGTLLHQASSQVESLKYLLMGDGRARFDVSARDDWGDSVLSLAVSGSWLESVKFLLQIEPSLLTSTLSTDGLNMLELAACTGDKEVFDYVLSKWPKESEIFTDAEAYLALLCYTAYGQEEPVIQKILTKNETYRKLVGEVVVTQEYQESSSDVKLIYSILSVAYNQATSTSTLPRVSKALSLGFAVYASKCNFEVIQMLASIGVKFDSSLEFNNSSAFFYSAAASTEMTEFLLSLDKTNLMGKSRCNSTAFYTACSSGAIWETAAVFLDAGADPNAAITFALAPERVGYTAIHNACRTKYVDAVKYLLTVDNVDVTVKDSEGSTPLHVLAATGLLADFRVCDAIEFVEEADDESEESEVKEDVEEDGQVEAEKAEDKVEVEAVEGEGEYSETAAAVINESADAVGEGEPIIIDSENDVEDIKADNDKEDVEVGEEKDEAAAKVVEEEQILDLTALIRKFIKRGADVNAVDNRGRTPLDVAKTAPEGIINGESDMIEAFVANGASCATA
ncbi:ankyrin repeat-containing domain protein [Obelidium mucronatum]|nr:ankyrin repeat-containing domain protein [Obelidium mucronatum]